MPDPTQPVGETTNPVTAVADRVTFPDKAHAPEPEPTPEHRPDIKNFADNKDTTTKVLSLIKGYKDDFHNQGAWTKFKTDADSADELWRAAVNRTQLNTDESANTQDTGSKVKSSTFYADTRIITAGEKAVILGTRTDLPVVYDPLPGATDYTADEGKRIAQTYNMLLSHTMEQDKMRRKIGRYLLRLNKYAVQLVEMKWDYRVEERTLRTKFSRMRKGDKIVKAPRGGENLQPDDIVFIKRNFTVADNPSMVLHDITKDCWFDAMIEDIQDQSMVMTRKQMQLGDIRAMQRSGEWKNVGDVTAAQLYAGEGIEEALANRQTNADEPEDTERPTTLLDLYTAWIRVPIDDESGEWKDKEQAAHWYEAVFCGDLEAQPICLMLRPNPHFCNKIPMFLGHSHDDDKGALSMGYAILVKSLIAQEMTAFDQFIDCNSTRNRVPLIADRGSINIRDKVFAPGGNRIWWKKPGAQDPHEVQIQDTTAQALPMLGEINERIRKAMGTNKPFLGEPMGSRTSASEAIGVLEQAVKPALEDTKDKGEPILEFAAFWNKEMWDEFGDPDTTVALTYGGKPVEIKPADFWGPLSIRVTSVQKFQDSLLQKKEADRFFSQFLPAAEKYMGPAGTPKALIQFAKIAGYDKVEEWFPGVVDFDARHVAQYENDAILFEGVTDFPKHDENHVAHNLEHKRKIAEYQMAVPKDEQDAEALGRLIIHAKGHDQFTKEAAAGAAVAQQTGQPGGGEGVGPRSPGEAAGDMMGAEAGVEENIPATGRPPLAVA